MPPLIIPNDTLQTTGLGADSIPFAADFLHERDAAADSITMLSAGGGMGVEADPVPYTTQHDGLILGTLFVLFVLYLVAYVNAAGFLVRQAKMFFRTDSERVAKVPDLPSELRSARLAWLALVVECGLLAFFYYKEVARVQTFVFSRYAVLGLLVLLFIGYFVAKRSLHHFVNWVFFDGKKIEQWNRAQLALAALQSVLILPLVVTAPFADIPLAESLIYILIVVFFIKIMSFYKTYIIFFRRFGAVLQISLYFCALELIPLAALGGLMVSIRDYLQINF